MNSGCVNGIDIESSVGAIDRRRWSWRQPCAQADEKEDKKEKTDGISMIMIIFMH
jgi:hypothetical protein